MKNKKIIFISSTGGHLTELLELKKIYEKYDSYFVTEKTKSSISIKDKFGKKAHFLLYGTKDHLLPYLFIFPLNILLSLILFIRIRPNYIISTGSHTAVPMCFIAKLFRRKVIYIETFANMETKTLAGKIVYPIADLFIVQWESMLKLYPKAVYGGWIFE